MIEIEAQRIAAVINLMRPEWRVGLIMTVLEDDRMIHRTYPDAMVAMVAMAVDPSSKKPGRIHEPGRWWQTVSAQAPTPQIRTITDADCAICSRPAHMHSLLSKVDPHEWEPQHARAESHKPTPEQRAALDAVAAEAHAKVTAAKEAAEKEREIAPVDEVLARHSNDDEREDVA